MALMLLGSTMISYTVKAVVIITLFLLLVIVCCATIDAIFGRCLLLEKLLLSLLNFGEVDHCIVSAGPHIFDRIHAVLKSLLIEAQGLLGQLKPDPDHMPHIHQTLVQIGVQLSGHQFYKTS